MEIKKMAGRGRFYQYRKGLFFDYERRARDFKNEHFNNQDWYVESKSFVFIRLNGEVLGSSNIYYDGHTVSSFTILGLEFGRGHTYDSRPAEEWKDGERLQWQ